MIAQRVEAGKSMNSPCTDVAPKERNKSATISLRYSDVWHLIYIAYPTDKISKCSNKKQRRYIIHTKNKNLKV